MPHFDTEYEAKLYHDRVNSLAKIAEIGQRLGLSYADATYPNSFAFTTTIPELRITGEAKSGEELEVAPFEAAIAGRLVAHRAQGKAGFAQLQGGGERIQIYVRKDDVGEDVFELYKLLHLGDHIGVRGTLMRTRTGELTLKAHAISLPEHVGKPAISFLTKATLALPDKYHGLEDVEARYRQRYVDLIMNSGTTPKVEPAPNSITLSSRPESQSDGVERPAVPATELAPGTSAVTDTAAPNEEHNDAPRNVREVFVKRAAVLRAIRRFFDERGYLEVETPMLHTVAGGATARPFTTHHNALDIPLSLRIAPELFLKRLVVGGMDRVYEINRNFRNEGVSTRHNPEFTMLEFYQAYANYHDLMDLTEELIKFVAMEVNGTTITHFNGNDIDLSKWQKLSMRKAIVKWWKVTWGAKPAESDFSDAQSLRALLIAAETAIEEQLKVLPPAFVRMKIQTASLEIGPEAARHIAESPEGTSLQDQFFVQRLLGSLGMGTLPGKVVAELFEHLAEEHLIQPTIIYDFPLAVSPLSKVKPDEPDWVERFEFYIGGFEVGNAFSELNDAEDQRRRFEAQLEAKAAGDDEAMGEMDDDYVRALGYGLPPTAGEGIGIDRLTMLLTGSRSIRDVILFPLMRPQGVAAQTKPAAEGGESAE